MYGSGWAGSHQNYTPKEIWNQLVIQHNIKDLIEVASVMYFDDANPAIQTSLVYSWSEQFTSIMGACFKMNLSDKLGSKNIQMITFMTHSNDTSLKAKVQLEDPSYKSSINSIHNYEGDTMDFDVSSFRQYSVKLLLGKL